MKDEKIVEPCSYCLKHIREKSTKFFEEKKYRRKSKLVQPSFKDCAAVNMCN